MVGAPSDLLPGTCGVWPLFTSLDSGVEARGGAASRRTPVPVCLSPNVSGEQESFSGTHSIPASRVREARGGQS